MRSLAVVTALLACAALADSPLTSTDFATAYADVPAVKGAAPMPGALEETYGFLETAKDSGARLAAANALGWEGDWATGFFEHLARAKGVKPEALDVKDLDAGQLFVAGYLVAMASYLDLKPLQPKGRGVWRLRGQELLERAAKQLPDDFTVQYTLALVKAQAAMTNEKRWCEVFKLPNEVERRFAPERRNLRPAALQNAHEYLGEYEEYCPGLAAQKKQKEELNQIYSLSKVGRQVVAGTQAGVVVWDPEQPQPVAIRPGFICRGVSRQGVAWLGCEQEVVRWDGKAFTSFLPTQKKGGGEYYEPTLGPNGELWVRRGKQAFVFDEKGQRFRAAAAPWKGDVYDARFAHGQWFWVQFLEGIRTPERVFKRASAEYPGNDPRTLAVDATGTLWVLDFGAGLYRFDEKAQRFVKVPGLDTNASGVAVDVERKRTWMLQYTEGLVLVRGDGKTETIALKELEYMRDLLLDENGDVWVAGWNQLVRVRADGATWVKQRFVAR